jgi:four helix bundle protein
VRFARQVPKSEVTSPLISQVVRSADSIGANYIEADEAQSKKEFRYRIGVCKKESRETGLHLRLIVAAVPALGDDARPLYRESRELTLIFASILRRRDRDDG